MLWSGYLPLISLVVSQERRSTAVLFWRAGAALMQAQLQFSVNMESSFWSLDGWLQNQLFPLLDAHVQFQDCFAQLVLSLGPINIIEIDYIFLCLLLRASLWQSVQENKPCSWKSLQIDRIPGEKKTLSVYWLAQFVDVLFIEWPPFHSKMTTLTQNIFQPVHYLQKSSCGC